MPKVRVERALQIQGPLLSKEDLMPLPAWIKTEENGGFVRFSSIKAVVPTQSQVESPEGQAWTLGIHLVTEGGGIMVIGCSGIEERKSILLGLERLMRLEGEVMSIEGLKNVGGNS